MTFDIFTPTYASSSYIPPPDDDDGQDPNQTEEAVGVAYLRPHAIKQGGLAAWRFSKKSLGHVASPTGGEIATWVTKEPPVAGSSSKGPAHREAADKAVWIASPGVFPPQVLDFFTETSTAFMTLQTLVATTYRLPDDQLDEAGVKSAFGPPKPEVVGYIARIVTIYLDEIAKLAYSRDVEPATRATYRAVFHIMQLARTLFLPRDGLGEGLLGEELLDWVNAVDPAPNNDQGNEILQSNPPWEHPAFWPYLQRCILRGLFKPANTFLRSLENHPVQAVKGLASTLASRLASLPRSLDSRFQLDLQFTNAHKEWKLSLEADLATQPGGRQGQWLGDEYSDMESEFKTVVELLEGNGDRVMAEASDWREALGAWGLLVDVSMTRDDLPVLCSRVFDRIPIDSAILSDSIQSSLCLGNTPKALIGCLEVDTWLAAHLADLFDKLALLPDEERFDVALRDYFILEYADALATNPAHSSMWDITVEYMYAAGAEGHLRLREYIMHVGLEAPPSRTNEEEVDGMDMDEDIKDPKLAHIAKLREICATHELEEEFAMISQIMADRYVRTGDYGTAASIYATSGNAMGMSDLADTLLGIYVKEGDETFTTKVAELPVSLLQVHANLEMDPEDMPFVFTPRLAFLAQFNEFVHARRNEDYAKASALVVLLLNTDLSPVGIRAVLLADAVLLLEDPGVHIDSKSTFELMRVLEEVASNAEYAPKEFVGQLQLYIESQAARAEPARAVMNGKKEGHGFDDALRKLDEVRLALARNLARVMVFDNQL